MSDETNNESTETANAGQPGEEQARPPARHVPVEEVAEERKRRQSAEKERDALKAKLEGITTDLSDLEKAQKQAEEFRQAAEKASVESLRFRIAAETGITENVDLILMASDEETMRRQAALWADRPPSSDNPAGPRPDLTQGGNPGANGGSTADRFAATFADRF